jgi:acetolactate synthase-1/3 small subunit
MTVVLYCSDEMILEQIKKQLAKLVDVRDIKELKPDESVRRELMLVKIRVNENERRNVIAISDVFRGRIVDVGQESLIVELTGNQSKLEGFLNLVQGYEILELARTGVTLQRSPRCALPRLTQITLHTFARGMKFLYRKVHFPDKQQKAEMLFAV